MTTPQTLPGVAIGVTYELIERRHDIPLQPFIWGTAEGLKLRICDMTDSHLINTIAHLRRHIGGNPHIVSNPAPYTKVFKTVRVSFEFNNYGEGILLNELGDDEHYRISQSRIYLHLLLEATRRGIRVTSPPAVASPTPPRASDPNDLLPALARLAYEQERERRKTFRRDVPYHERFDELSEQERP